MPAMWHSASAVDVAIDAGEGADDAEVADAGGPVTADDPDAEDGNGGVAAPDASEVARPSAVSVRRHAP